MILLVLAAAVFLVLLAIRKLYDRFWAYQLTASVSFRDGAVYEGEKTELREIIVNDKLLPIPTLEIDFHLHRNLRLTAAENSTVSDKTYRRDVFSLGGKKKITRHLELDCTKRGYYTLEKLGLSANDLFMAKRYLTSFDSPGELYVYPARIPTEKIAIPFNKIMGDILSRSRVYDDPFEFGGIRDYMISDPMKYINWKASAKSGKLVVNLHDSSLSQKVSIILDTYDSAAPLDDELNEECIRIASALSERIIAQGISLSLTGNGFDLISGKGLRLLEIKGSESIQLKKTLSRLTWNDGETAAQVMNAMEVTENTLFVLLSKNATEENREAFARLAAKNEALWILPYKEEQPKVSSDQFKILFWQDE